MDILVTVRAMLRVDDKKRGNIKEWLSHY